MSRNSGDLSAFLNACASGDQNARLSFQETYGEDIYNFPVKIYGTPREDAADYYVYVFDRDRIFLRLRTFEGRNHIQFRTFLSYYVLKHLFMEWQRTCKEIDTISLQTLINDHHEGQRTLEDLLPASVATEPSHHQPSATLPIDLLDSLTPEDCLLLKLLSLLEYQLSPADVRLLAAVSQRTIHDTLTVLADVQYNLKRKDTKVTRLYDELDTVWGWIVLRQKELYELHKQTPAFSILENIVDKEQRRVQQQALEHALAKRFRQRERLIEELRTYKLTTPYKDLARLLNVTIGTVASRLFRVREQLTRRISETGIPAALS